MTGGPDVAVATAEAVGVIPVETSTGIAEQRPRDLKAEFIAQYVRYDDEGKLILPDATRNRLEEMRVLNVAEADTVLIGKGDDFSKNYVHATTIGLIEAAKAGLLPDITPEARVIFTELSTRAVIPRSGAPYLADIVDVLLEGNPLFSSGDHPLTKFEETYMKLVPQNPIAAKIIWRALTQAHRTNQIVVDKFEEKFPNPTTAIERLKEARQRQQAEAAGQTGTTPSDRTKQDEAPTQRPKTAPRVKTEQEVALEKEYMDLYRTVATQISDYEKRVYSKWEPTLDSQKRIMRDKDGNPLNPAISPDRRRLLDSILSQGKSPEGLSDDDKEFLRSIGIETTSLTRLASLYGSVGSDSSFRIGEYTPIRAMTPDEMKEYIKGLTNDAERSVGTDLAAPFVEITLRFQRDFVEGTPMWKKYLEQVQNPRFPGDPSKKIWVFKEDRNLRKEFQREFVDRPLYSFFERIDKDVTRTYRDIYNPIIHGRYLEHVMGLLRGLQRNLEGKVDIASGIDERFQRIHLGTDPTNKLNVQIGHSLDFMDTMINYGNSLQNYGQIFHDLPIYANDPSSIEKWGGMLASLPASQQAMFLDDPLIEIAQSVYGRHLRSRIALNGDKIPADILGGKYDPELVRSSIPDLVAVRNDLTRIVEIRRPEGGRTIEDWEFARAATFARGIQLLNLRAIEIIGSARIADHYRGIPDLVAKTSQRHKWNQGRGGQHNQLTPEVIGSMYTNINPVRGNWLDKLVSRMTATKHDPVAIKKLAEESLHAFGLQGMDFDLTDQYSTYLELMNIFNLGSLFTRQGWRIQHILGYEDRPGHKGIADEMKSAGLNKGEMMTWDRAQWGQFYDIITSQIGSGATWFWGGQENSHSGLAASMTEQLFHHYGKSQGWSDDEIHHKQHSYWTEGKDTFKVIGVKVQGHQESAAYARREMDLTSIYQQHLHQSRGLLLERMMRRSPGDFLLTAIQMAPQLVEYYKDEATSVWGTPTDEKIINQQRKLINLFGEHGFKQLQGLRDWVIKLDTAYSGDDRFKEEINPNYADPQLKRKAIVEFAIKELGVALENTRQIHELRSRDGTRSNDLTMQPDAIPDHDGKGTLRKLVFGEDAADKTALLSMWTSDDLDHGDVDKINQKSFFFGLAKAWTTLNGDTHIDTADIDNYQIYEDIAGVGELVIKRLVGDQVAWNEVTEQLMGIDELIEEVGRTGELEPVYELAKHIFELRKIIGEEPAKKAVYIMASMVATYMWEHDLARFPFITNTPWGFFLQQSLGDNISLSRLRFGRHAHSMDTDQIRSFFHTLGFELGVIGTEGRWSYQHGKESFDATNTEWFLSELMVGGGLTIATIIIYLMIKKAMEEQSGGGHH